MKNSITRISLVISVLVTSVLSLPSPASASNCSALYRGTSYYADLSYCNLSGWDFSVSPNTTYNYYANFASANLENTNFSGRNFYRSNFSGANINGAMFVSSRLHFANFSNASAIGVDFSAASEINGARFGAANLSNSKLSGRSFGDSNFTGANLHNADLTGATFSGASFDGADFTGANLTGATFWRCNLANITLEGTRLDSTSFDGSTSSNVSGTPLQLDKKYRLVNGYLLGPGMKLTNAELPGADLSHLDLSKSSLGGSNLSGVNFHGSILKGANLSETSLVGSDFTAADLTKTILRGANLSDVDFHLASLKGAKLQDATLVGSDFTAADLSYANLEAADASAANFTYARLFHSTVRRTNLTGAIFSHAVLGQSNFNEASMDSTDLSTAILNRGIQSSNISGLPLMPNGWMFRRGYMLGPYVQINQADLSGLNLAGLNLTGASLNQVNFRDAVLSNVKFDRSYLYGANFTNADLSNSVFSETTVDSVNFNNATLRGVKSGGLVFRVKPRIPAGWRLLNSYLVGPSAVLSGANFNSLDLSGFDLSDSVLYGVNLAGANLNNANLSRVKLSGAILAGATLEGVTSSGIVGQPTVMPDGWVVDEGSVVRALTNTPKPEIQGVYKANQTITARAGSWDSGVQLTYSWLRDGAEIAEANSPSYRLTSADTGHQISVRVSGSKVGYQRVSVESRAFFVAEESLAASISGESKVGSILTAGPSNLGQASVTYQWFKNGRAVKGATSSTYFPQVVDLGTKISVVATILVQGSGKIVSTSPAVTIASGILEAPEVSLSGVPVLGESLSANVPTIAGVKSSTKWYRDGVALAGGKATYTPKVTDVGHKFKVVSTFSKKGFLNVVSESQEYLIAPAIATATSGPTLTGFMQPGKVLKVKNGVWMSSTKFEYQWLRDGSPIDQANFSTYQLLSSDKGKQISVRVTGQKAGYTSLTLLSNSLMFD